MKDCIIKNKNYMTDNQSKPRTAQGLSNCEVDKIYEDFDAHPMVLSRSQPDVKYKNFDAHPLIMQQRGLFRGKSALIREPLFGRRQPKIQTPPEPIVVHSNVDECVAETNVSPQE